MYTLVPEYLFLNTNQRIFSFVFILYSLKPAKANFLCPFVNSNLFWKEGYRLNRTFNYRACIINKVKKSWCKTINTSSSNQSPPPPHILNKIFPSIMTNCGGSILHLIREGLTLCMLQHSVKSLMLAAQCITSSS